LEVALEEMAWWSIWCSPLAQKRGWARNGPTGLIRNGGVVIHGGSRFAWRASAPGGEPLDTTLGEIAGGVAAEHDVPVLGIRFEATDGDLVASLV
jgi:hypothetical protein